MHSLPCPGPILAPRTARPLSLCSQVTGGFEWPCPRRRGPLFALSFETNSFRPPCLSRCCLAHQFASWVSSYFRSHAERGSSLPGPHYSSQFLPSTQENSASEPFHALCPTTALPQVVRLSRPLLPARRIVANVFATNSPHRRPSRQILCARRVLPWPALLCLAL